VGSVPIWPSSTAYWHQRGTSLGLLGKAGSNQQSYKGEQSSRLDMIDAKKECSTYLFSVTVLAFVCLNIELALLNESFLKFFCIKSDLVPELLLLLLLFLKVECVLTVDKFVCWYTRNDNRKMVPIVYKAGVAN
jgi:hypothetical protein